MTQRSTLPAQVVREAAELLASYRHFQRLMGGEIGGGPTIKDFIERLAAASGEDHFFAYTAPNPGFNKPLTVAARSYNGSYRACVLPGKVSAELVATQFLDQADSGLLARDEAWGDPRYIGVIHPLVHPDGRKPWWNVPPRRGLVARVAWAANFFADHFRRGSVPEDQLREVLFERELYAKDAGVTARFTEEADPFVNCWNADQPGRVIAALDTIKMPARGRMDFPLQVLRHRGKLGYGALIAYWLTLDYRGPGMTQTEAAAAMSLKDRKSASALARSAQRKLGKRISITQLVPAFPASDVKEPAPTPQEEPKRRQEK